MGGKYLLSGSEPDVLIGNSPLLRQAIEKLMEVAPIDVTVLIQGETGTGKGVAARSVHAHSHRHRGGFVQLNCGGMPEGLVEAELFGHEKGAFTGALQQRIGKVELAAGGTLFLDEIGDMNIEVQTRLLHVLEERTFTRLGSNQAQAVQARIIAATHRDLNTLVEKGRFRQDLFFRLHVIPVWLPPLREHKEDIPLLLHHFLPTIAAHLNKSCPRVHLSAMEVLMAYDWPGNVRELKHAAERATIACKGEEITAEHLPLVAANVQRQQEENRLLLSLGEIERRHILDVLRITNGVVKGERGAAEILGMPASTLYSRMRRMGIQQSRT